MRLRNSESIWDREITDLNKPGSKKWGNMEKFFEDSA